MIPDEVNLSIQCRPNSMNFNIQSTLKKPCPLLHIIQKNITVEEKHHLKHEPQDDRIRLMQLLIVLVYIFL